MSDIAKKSAAILDRLRDRTSWLLDDGFEVVEERLRPTSVDLKLKGPHALVELGVDVGRSHVEFLISPSSPTDSRFHLDYLKARGLRVPPARLDARTMETTLRSIDDQIESLKQLRHHELAGDWLEIHDEAERRAQAIADEQLIQQLVAEAKAKRQK